MPSRPRWLSFTSTISDSDPRWFTPPPARTAAFSSARRPGSVLRVSQTRARLPGASAAASTKRRVNVAIPERWQRKFSEVRSAVRIDASGPSTVPMTSRASTVSPSVARQWTTTELSTCAKASVAHAVPASTPRLRGTNEARPCSPGSSSAAVMSPSGPRSSASARADRVADDAGADVAHRSTKRTRIVSSSLGKSDRV